MAFGCVGVVEEDVELAAARVVLVEARVPGPRPDDARIVTVNAQDRPEYGRRRFVGIVDMVNEDAGGGIEPVQPRGGADPELTGRVLGDGDQVVGFDGAQIGPRQ